MYYGPVLQGGYSRYCRIRFCVAEGQSSVQYISMIPTVLSFVIAAEIASITANIDALKADLKTKKAELKSIDKEIVKLEAKKAKADAKTAEEAKKAEAESVLKKLLAQGVSADEILAKLK